MSLTLLVETNPKLESFYTLNLSTWLGLETVNRTTAEEAIHFLEQTPAVKLIIVRSKMAWPVLNYKKDKALKTHIIIMGTGDFPGETVLTNTLDLRPLIKSAATALGITAKDMSSKVVPDFYPIPMSIFPTIRKSVSDIFQKNDTLYQVVFKKNCILEQDKVYALMKVGVNYLYVDKQERLNFVNHASLELIASLESEKLNEDEQLTAIDKGVELLSKKLLSIGVNEETISLANKNMAQIKDQVKKNPNLASLVARLFKNKSSYLYLHTQVLTYIALHIIKNIDWGTPEQEEKMSFICFFHDIALETDEQASIKTSAQLKLSQLPPEKKQLVEKHAQIAGELVSKFPHAPMSADQIIKQHHGMLNGLGFSEHFGANISPIATVFIVAEEFTRIVLKRESGPFDRNDMLGELKAEFPSARFQKTLDLLKTITF